MLVSPAGFDGYRNSCQCSVLCKVFSRRRTRTCALRPRRAATHLQIDLCTSIAIRARARSHQCSIKSCTATNRISALIICFVFMEWMMVRACTHAGYEHISPYFQTPSPGSVVLTKRDSVAYFRMHATARPPISPPPSMPNYHTGRMKYVRSPGQHLYDLCVKKAVIRNI